MRRHDRAIEGIDALTQVLSRCDILRLAVSDGGVPYIVPLCFGAQLQGDRLSLFFHSARQGRKIDALRRNPVVGFEADCSFRIIRGEGACEWTAHYESVVGTGTVTFLDAPKDAEFAMDMIMRKYGFEGKPEYAPHALAAAQLMRLNVESISGKRNL